LWLLQVNSGLPDPGKSPHTQKNISIGFLNLEIIYKGKKYLVTWCHFQVAENRPDPGIVTKYVHTKKGS
jgi:hypothetical protein